MQGLGLNGIQWLPFGFGDIAVEGGQFYFLDIDRNAARQRRGRMRFPLPRTSHVLDSGMRARKVQLFYTNELSINHLKARHAAGTPVVAGFPAQINTWSSWARSSADSPFPSGQCRNRPSDRRFVQSQNPSWS